MAKKKESPGTDELIRLIDQSITSAMQEQARLVLSGKLPEARNRLATGAFQGLERAKEIMTKTYNAFLKDEDNDED